MGEARRFKITQTKKTRCWGNGGGLEKNLTGNAEPPSVGHYGTRPSSALVTTVKFVVLTGGYLVEGGILGVPLRPERVMTEHVRERA